MSIKHLFEPALPVYGVHKDRHDARDVKKVIPVASGTLPVRFSLEQFSPLPLNQGPVGACTGYAFSGFMYNTLCRRFGREKAFNISPYFSYAEARKLAGWPNVDNGAYLRDTMKVAHQLGVCPYGIHPTSLGWQKAPDDAAKAMAGLYKIKGYERIESGPGAAASICKVMAVEHLPVLIGIMLYTSFNGAWTRTTGNISMPTPTEPFIGGHAMYLDGYDMKENVFLGQNSYGRSWGRKGRFTIPMTYLETPHLVLDIWTLSKDYD